MSYSLGIDSSTQSISAIVLDLDKNTIVYDFSINFGKSLPQYNAPNGFIEGDNSGEFYSNPLMWLDALDLLIKDLTKKCDVKKIKSISGAGQQHGSVYLNSNWSKTILNLDPNHSLSSQIKDCLSRKISPIWMDSSTSEECGLSLIHI